MSNGLYENGWGEYRRMVVGQLDQLTSNQREIQADISEIKAQLASLKTEMQLRAGMWGTVAGVVASGVAHLLSIIIQ